jgi:hypothetical protein
MQNNSVKYYLGFFWFWLGAFLSTKHILIELFYLIGVGITSIILFLSWAFFKDKKEFEKAKKEMPLTINFFKTIDYKILAIVYYVPILYISLHGIYTIPILLAMNYYFIYTTFYTNIEKNVR